MKDYFWLVYVGSFLFSFMSSFDSVSVVSVAVLSFLSLSLILLKSVSMSVVFFSNQFYPLFLDEVSFYLIILSFLVTYLSIYSSMYHIKESDLSKYIFLMLFILLMLTILFSIGSYLSFFVIFEFIMMPMVFIISIWGSQKERLTANYYFFFYTLLGGVPLMLCVLNMMKEGSSFFLLMKVSNSFNVVSFATILVVILAFLCKLPFYSTHIWLPKAHVEAPVSGSMVLAGLLLKMSSYSMMRVFMLLLVPLSLSKYIFLCLLGVSIIYPMIICFRQVDLKSFIAYSSVSHMSVALAGLVVYNIYGMLGSFIVFLSHSLISPLMFYSVNLLYERVSTRIVVSMSGFELSVKFFFYYFLLVFVANMSYPPFVSFFSELSLYFSLVSFNFYITFLLFIFIFFSSVVMVYFLVKIFKSKGVQMKFVYLSSREIMVYWMSIYFLCSMTLMVPVF